MAMPEKRDRAQKNGTSLSRAKQRPKSARAKKDSATEKSAGNAKRPRGRPVLIDDKTWIEAALKIMAFGGIDAVRVEPIAATLGVTKGAFYSRFKSREEFLEILLDYWRKESTLLVIAHLSAFDETPEERLMRVLLLPFRRPDVKERGRMEMALRLWADRSSAAAATMKEIDSYRLQYFESVLVANGLSRETASSRAFLIYSYIIADGVLPGERDERIRKQCREFLAQGTPLVDRKGAAQARRPRRSK